MIITHFTRVFWYFVLHPVLILPLHPKRNTIAGKRSPIVHTTASDHWEEVTGKLFGLKPFSLKDVDTADDKALCGELVDRHHYLGCPRPFGFSLHWFVVATGGHRLGCLLMEVGTRQLPARDECIGWDGRQRVSRPSMVKTGGALFNIFFGVLLICY